MTKFSRIFLLFTSFFMLCVVAQAQQKPTAKIDDVFFDYVSKTLELKPSEAVQMRPLVKKYLSERRKTERRISDPLEREQEILNLKMSARKEMAAVIGMTKANAFFSSEQNFRRKVREVLKQRQEGEKKN